MTAGEDEPSGPEFWPAVMFIGSAAAAAFLLLEAWREPMIGVLALGLAGSFFLARFVSRQKAKRLFLGGDVEAILARWSGSVAKMPHFETMGPLMTATAFAAYGWVARARSALVEAERGEAWEAALEQRLFLDAILLTFEGDTDAALDRASRLARLPMPTTSPSLVERIGLLRAGVAALARAFAHDLRDGDVNVLIAASDASPLVHWAMRYGAAIALIDTGELTRARALIADAPAWSQESCFLEFHREIDAELGRREPAA
ncbi:MAG: hypothetical protein EXR75_10795 [Myxococcales bacterium]|nr:hypothetical protein [Myxococcales bacterium]